ncbi:BatD family protein [Oceanospirillum sanctuarii]|uniref:BatD family protein n=1 Tax=Oceanospirillum sanctuarii TaxID=1434821 RepID=UPI000A3D3CF8|nr:BatD family protein [Oceanospirillum sanctuarii]
MVSPIQNRLSFIHLLTVFCLLSSCLLFAGISAASELEASVDRNRLTENESVTLFLKAPGLQLTGEPELSELHQDFEVLAQQVRTNIQIANGQNLSERVWEISLLPRRTGTLIIPAITIGDASSQPITLEVQPEPANTQASADVFLHSEIDHSDTIYVQQQLIYTLRLYYATSISDHGLTDLDLDNVLLVQLGNRKDFEARIDGRLYNVAEWQFALYPQSSGELVIPPQTFSGRVRIQNRYSLGGLKHIRIQSPEHKINVLPVPDAFPANAQWLPAKDLTLSQEWSGNYAQWQEGTPLTRKLTLEAQGLTAAQLPPLVMSPMQGVRQYPEQPQLNERPENLNQKGAGMVGEKTLSIALIPTESGDLNLPEIRVPWWNTETDQLEYATLDALPLTISADPNKVKEPQPVAPANNPNQQALLVPQGEDNSFIWQICTLIFATLSAVLATFLWQSKQQLTFARQQLFHGMTVGGAIASQSNAAAVEENPIFRQALLNACQQNQARAAWDAWQKWQRLEAPQTTPEFDQALHQLQMALFGPDAQPENWQGKDLANASEGVKRAAKSKDQPLPELYPSQ